MQQPEKEERKPEPKTYSYNDLIQFETKNLYSSFG